MPKKGFYSPEAFIDRAKEQAARVKQPEQKQTTTPTPPQDAKFVLPSIPSSTTPVLPPIEDWDYKTAKTDMQGNPIKSVKLFGTDLTPLGFTPHGNLYFGGGLTGKLKEYAYALVGDEIGESEKQKKWDTFWDTSKQYVELAKEVAKKGEKGTAEGKEASTLFFKGVSSFFSAAKSSVQNVFESEEKIQGLGISSPLTPLLRLSTLGLKAVMDVFQEVSELPEQAMGVNKAQREFATEQGSILPDLAFEDEDVMNIVFKEGDGEDANSRIETRSEFVNFTTRLLGAGLRAYDEVRFWTAPGTLKQKTEAVKAGWIEGSMLYSELVHPTIEAEYQRRAQNGEDPYLLAMELEDPWAELAGEVLLDPLNLVGIGGKAKKIAATIDDASTVVQKSGLLGDEKAIGLMKDIQNISTDAQASAKLDEFAELVTDYSKNIHVAQNYKATALSAAGNRARYHKTVGNFMSNLVQSVRNVGGTPDDILEYTVALIKRASGNKDQIKAAIATLSKSPIAKYAYNQAGFETGHILQKLMGDGDSLIKAIKEAGTDWNKMRGVLDGKIQDSLKFVFPSVSEMSQASEKVKALALVGNAPDKKTIALAERFAELKNTDPGVVRRLEVEDFIGKFINPINGFLANNYFSLNYGYAFRNLIQNFFTIGVDGGWKITDGIPGIGNLAAAKIDESIIKRVGDIPVSLRGKTLVESLTTDSLFKKFFSKLNTLKYSPASLSNAAEVYSSKLIWLKYFDNTMNDAVKLGTALPEIAQWEQAGFTASQAGDFVNILKANNYNEVDAVKIFNTKYGSGTYDKWRTLDYVNKNAKKGLEEVEDFWSQIVNAVNKADTDQSEVLSVIDNLKKRAIQMGDNAKYDIPSMSQENPAWKQIANAKEWGGKYYTEAMGTEEITLRLARDEALNKMDEALKTAAKKLSQDAMTEQNPQKQDLAARIIDWLGSSENRAQSSKIDIEVGEKLNWTRDVYNKAKKSNNVASLWDEAALGAKPGLINFDILSDALWKNYFNFKKTAWDNYSQFYLKNAIGLAKEVGVEELFADADKAIVQLNAYRNMHFSNQGVFAKIPTPPKGFGYSTPGQNGHDLNVRKLAENFGVTDQKKALLNTINKYGDKKFTSLTDVTLEDAQLAFQKKMGVETDFVSKWQEGEIEKVGEAIGRQVPPPHDPLNPPSAARAMLESRQGILDALNHVADGIKKNWGLQAIGGNSDVSLLTRELSERMTFARGQAAHVANYWRDFALLPYGETKNMDFAMSLVYPYQFWYKGTYANWMKRAISTNPEIISRYANLKDTMAKEHAGLPEWYKYQVQFFGKTDNPVMFNLEATIWPLYGLTGTDFNDPEKRTNWFTAMIDDAGKFGPSIWAPIQWAVAAKYAIDGEADIAAKWGTRAIPQTATFKAISSYFGTPVELDPNVMLFNGDKPFDFQASDPHEEGRISRALAAMEKEGVYTKEQLLEAARTHKGPIWEEAYQRAVQKRAPGQIMSALLGVGFRPRTEDDVETDQFYADYFRMRNLHDGGYMSDQQYQQGFNEMRERYPFMDLILLSRRAGVGREAAYAYNVISRIPPGMSKEIYEAVGVDPETAQKFYDGGGKFTGMDETEKSDFINSMINIGAMLAIPSNTTRRQWTEARGMYAEMNEFMAEDYGEDIHDKIGLYFNFDSTTEARAYLDANPDVAQAMDDRSAYIANNPQLLKYYGGIDTIERYYTGLMYDELEKKFGENITEVAAGYTALRYDPAAQKQYKKEHPELKAFWEARDAGYDKVLQTVVKFGSHLPDASEELTLREDLPPELNPKQERIQSLAQPEPKITADQWTEIVGETVMQKIVESQQTGKDLPYSVRSYLKNVAEREGLPNENALLQSILISLEQP